MSGIFDEQEPSVQSSEQVWSWGMMYLPKYGKWLSQPLYLKINFKAGSIPEKIASNNIRK